MAAASYFPASRYRCNFLRHLIKPNPARPRPNMARVEGSGTLGTLTSPLRPNRRLSIAKPAGSAPTRSRNTPAICSVPSSDTSPRNSIPVPVFDTEPSNDPSRAKAVMAVLPAALKKPPSNPTPARSISNRTAMGPLKIGVPESTGELGASTSLTIDVLGEAASSDNGPLGVPTTQALAAAPGQSMPGIPLNDCPVKNPSKVTVGDPTPPP